MCILVYNFYSNNYKKVMDYWGLKTIKQLQYYIKLVYVPKNSLVADVMATTFHII